MAAKHEDESDPSYMAQLQAGDDAAMARKLGRPTDAERGEHHPGAAGDRALSRGPEPRIEVGPSVGAFHRPSEAERIGMQASDATMARARVGPRTDGGDPREGTWAGHAVDRTPADTSYPHALDRLATVEGDSRRMREALARMTDDESSETTQDDETAEGHPGTSHPDPRTAPMTATARRAPSDPYAGERVPHSATDPMALYWDDDPERDASVHHSDTPTQTAAIPPELEADPDAGTGSEEYRRALREALARMSDT